jgi:hypothetical protein
VFNGETGEQLASAPNPNSYTRYILNSLWFSPDGRLVTGKYAHQALWNPDSLQQTLNFDALKLTAHYSLHNQACRDDHARTV